MIQSSARTNSSDLKKLCKAANSVPNASLIQKSQKAHTVSFERANHSSSKLILLGVSGELIRTDVLEGSQGVKLNLDINVIDVTTCKPIPNIYVELWGCNSTVSISGVKHISWLTYSRESTQASWPNQMVLDLLLRQRSRTRPFGVSNLPVQMAPPAS